MKPLEPVQFDDPTPEGRKPGDCKLCATDGKADAAFCDCQLRYTTAPGKTVRWLGSPAKRMTLRKRAAKGTPAS